MNRVFQKRRPQPSEEGYILVAVIFMMVILILSLAIAVPKVRESIQRDRDVETMQRGKQYIRAIQLYYRKFNAYPPNVDALVKTNNIRFLRKKYVDPTTGKDDWKPIMFGQNKTPMAMGFFGQPLAGTPIAGIGPSGGNGLNGAAGASAGGLFNNSTTTDSSTTGIGQSGTDANGNPTGGAAAGATGTDQSGSAAAGSSTNPTGNGQTFGGAGIVGFSPQSPKQSILVYKKKNHYNEWEFLYSPLSDQQTMAGGNTGIVGQPASGTTNPIGSGTTSTTPTGTTTPTTPSSPQQ
jgi:type II secretory pathway pseudopilin PulG